MAVHIPGAHRREQLVALIQSQERMTGALDLDAGCTWVGGRAP